MDPRLLSITIALDAKRRGAPASIAVAIAEDATRRILEVPNLDLMGCMMIIDQVMAVYGYPER